MTNSDEYDDTFRVSVKARIRNNLGEILFVKEDGSEWILPGGGIRSGESLADGLSRELEEEIGVTSFKTTSIVGVETFYADWRGAWVLWVIMDVELDSGSAIRCGCGVTDARFILPERLKTSTEVSYQLARKWALAA